MARLCINPATTMPTDFVTDVRAYSAAGFEAMELWLDKVERYLEQGHDLRETATLLRDQGLATPAACAQGNLLLPQGAERAAALDQLRRRLEILQALGCPVLIVPAEALPQPVPRPVASLYEMAAAHLAGACELARPFGVSLALEFIKGARLAGTPLTAQEIVARSGQGNAGVLFDTFHFYAGYGKMEDLEKLDGRRLLFVHVNDAPGSIPREALTDRDRVLPGEGVFPLAAIVERLRRVGYAGHYSLELFNEQIWAEDPFTAAARAHRAMLAQIGEG
jgi:2-keto-myo-inositol isomerase